jgi:hypothetical protein
MNKDDQTDISDRQIADRSLTISTDKINSSSGKRIFLFLASMHART